MRNTNFADQCFVVIVVLAFVAILSGLAFSFIEAEPRGSKASLMLQNFRP